MTGLALDAGLHAPWVWKLNIPPRLRELLWKDVTGSLPIGATWFGNMECGRTCGCSAELTLTHIWSSCRSHNLAPLMQELWAHLPALPDSAPAWTHPWYPLLALRELESARQVSKKAAKELWNVGAPTFLLLLFCFLSRYDVYRRSILHVYIRAHSGLANLTVLLRSLAPLGMTIYITVLLHSLAPLGPTASYRPTGYEPCCIGLTAQRD